MGHYRYVERGIFVTVCLALSKGQGNSKVVNIKIIHFSFSSQCENGILVGLVN